MIFKDIYSQGKRGQYLRNKVERCTGYELEFVCCQRRASVALHFWPLKEKS
jgi:hypothetical protein